MNHIISMISSRSKFKNGILIEDNNLNTELRYDNIIKELDNNIVNQDKINEFFNLITGSKSNSAQPLSIIEKCTNIAPLYSKILVNNFTKNILPCIDNYKGVAKELEHYKGITTESKNNILESISNLEVADRIYTNHQTLSKRFDINKNIRGLSERNLNYNKIVNNIYSLVETYDIKEYQKMNLVIEEVTYLLEKNGIKYNPKVLYETIIKYCASNTDESIDNISRVISESKLIDKSDIEYLVNFLKKQDSKKDLVHGWWLKYIDRGEQKLPESIKEICENTPSYNYMIGINSFISNIDSFTKANSYHKIFENYIEELNRDIISRDFDREFLKEFRESLSESLSNKNLSKSTIELFNPVLEEVNREIEVKYPAANLIFMKIANYNDEPVSLYEFGLQYNALTKAIEKFNKFLKRKEHNGQFSKLKSKFKNFGQDKLTSALFGESMSDNIGSDNRADIVVDTIYFDESDNIEKLSDYVNGLIFEFNSEIEAIGENHIAAYYTIVEGAIDIHIKNNTILKEDESIPVKENSNIIEESNDSIDKFMNKALSINYRPVYEYLNSIRECSDFSIDHFNYTLEALSYLGVDKTDIKEFADMYSDYRFNKHYSDEDKSIFESVNNWESKNNGDLDISLEAYDILVAIFEDAGLKNILSESTLEDRMKKSGYLTDKDIKNDELRNKNNNDEDDDKSSKYNDDDEDDDKPSTSNLGPTNLKAKSTNFDDVVGKNKKKKKKLSLTDIKLMLKGLDAKIKDKGSNIKNKVKMFDSSVSRYIKSIKDAQSNERREQIIKGSVIPSFSSCIKLAIVLSGMGVLVALGVINIIIPVITAIGAFAINTTLTERERLLILDEIDTELEIIDKEMTIADNNNQINKYRALIRYKKNLQRQYQRIRYNVRIGKDISPDMGMQPRPE